MATPAFLLTGILRSAVPTAYLDDETSMFHGYPTEWEGEIEVNPQLTSSPGNDGDFVFTGRDVAVGDWVGSYGGTAMKIKSILEQDDYLVRAILEDEDNYNMLSDPTMAGSSLIAFGNCIVFKVSESGLPVLGPVPVYYLDLNAQNDLVARFLHQGKLRAGTGGPGGNTLEDPTDGDITNGAIDTWTVGETTYTDAIDQLNGMMLKLMPPAPPALRTKNLSISGAVSSRNGANVLLANGVTNNSPELVEAGTQIAMTTNVAVTTANVENFSEAQRGILHATINGVVDGSITLNSSDNTAADGALVILSETDYPEDKPGFWKALTARVSKTLNEGVNVIGLTHTVSGDANPAVFVVDPVEVTPVVDSATLAPVSTGPYFYSSGVPHYTNSVSLTLDATLNGLASNVYLNRIGRLSSTPNIGHTNVIVGENNIPLVLDKNHSEVIITDIPVTLGSSNTHVMSEMTFVAANAQTDSEEYTALPKVLFAHGTPTSGVIEAGKAMSSATLKRVKMGAGSRPDDVLTTFVAATFDSGTDGSVGDASAPHEAVIRGGVLLNDTTDYTMGYFPAGPDFSSKPATQYASFVIKKAAASNMRITFTGADPAELWIKLPGLDLAQPNATNNWWDAKKAADFAPGQWPGSAGASDGCMSSKSDLTYNITFGSGSSSNSADNMVVIRVALTAGQTITNISVTL